MSCNPIEILPNDAEIVQLQKDLFQARYDANYYKYLHRRNVAARERVQYNHDVEIRRLKQKHTVEIPAAPLLAFTCLKANSTRALEILNDFVPFIISSHFWLY